VSSPDPRPSLPSLPSGQPKPARVSFGQDFRRFFLRGLAAILPTLITLWLLLWLWDFLWQDIGQFIINLISFVWYYAGNRGWVTPQSPHYIYDYALNKEDFTTRLLGVGLAIALVYSVGVFVSKLIGRAFWRVAEQGFHRIPLVRAIYPAVKQITDFVLADRSNQFQFSRVVAVQPHEQNIWSIGLVTSAQQWVLGESGPEEMMTVFVPSTPTSFSGYVLVVPRSRVIELPMTVEEALRLLVSGGVIMPPEAKTAGSTPESSPPESSPSAIKITVSSQLEKTG
jgi:uncharacterized membrane protein